MPQLISNRFKPRRMAVMAALLWGLLMGVSGCGYRGPLYLPDEAPPEAQTQQPAPPAQTDTEGEDSEEEDGGR